MQHRGHKAWTLWAPWDLIDADGDTVPAHTRFEALAAPGDAMYYPPAWFHATRVTDNGHGGSLTAAVDLLAFPSFGALANRSTLQTPFGYGACASGSRGWYAQSAVWDRVLLGMS